MYWYERIGKRLIDVTLSGLLMIMFVPLYALVAAIVRVSIGSPIIFRQRRPGLNEKMFTILKFRTMSLSCDSSGRFLPDHMRLSRIGQALRASSLDELPELWNVFRGDMSLVGPRPLLEEYIPLYTESQRRRHSVRPGITGLAQVRGRNLTTWRRRFALDVFYVNHQTLALDVKICVATLMAMFRSDGGVASVQRLNDLAENARLRGSF